MLVAARYASSVVNNEGSKKKQLPFANGRDSAEFQRELVLFLIRELDARRTKHIPAENLLVFQHGRGWNFQRQEKDGYNPRSGQMELKSSTTTIDMRRLLANDVTLISDFIQKMAGAMEEQFVSGLVSEMCSVAEETGNTISIPKTGITGEAFLEMIRRTEVLVGSDGKASRPSLFLPPETIDKMVHDLEQLGPEFKAKVDALWIEKEKEALKREEERLARFDHTE